MEQQLSMNETEIAAEKSGKDAGAAKPVTRAAKAGRQKEILRALLEKKPYKWNDLLEEAVKEYTAKYPEENADIPDIKGKFGSNFSLMENAGEVLFDKATNMCSLKKAEPQKPAEKLAEKPAEKLADKKAEPKKRGRKPAAKAESKAEKTAEKIEETVQKKEEEKRAAIENALKKAVEKAVAKAEAIGKKRTKKTAEAPAEKPAEEKAEPKKRGRKPAAETEEKAEKKAEVKAEETPIEKPIEKPVETAALVKREEKPSEKSEKNAPAKAAPAPAPAKNETKKDVKKDLWLTDFVFLGNASNAKKEESNPAGKAEKTEVKPETKIEQKAEIRQEEKPVEERKTEPKIEGKPEPKSDPKSERKPQRTAQPRAAQPRSAQPRSAQAQTQPRSAQTRSAQSQSSSRTADEKLKEEFLKRLRALSGEYFEYYSVYLLERYSLKSGRRLEGLCISGGKNDGGIDGEIELTDRFGFRETIYIQAKNWDPTKGLAEKWMIGETLIQQFVGAATCRQMQDGKRNCRGIFVTTSNFTKDAKDSLEVLGEKFIGYDGNDVFETAKECEFGLIKVNGVWQLDEKLLAGDKAFFNMI